MLPCSLIIGHSLPEEFGEEAISRYRTYVGSDTWADSCNLLLTAVPHLFVAFLSTLNGFTAALQILRGNLDAPSDHPMNWDEFNQEWESAALLLEKFGPFYEKHVSDEYGRILLRKYNALIKLFPAISILLSPRAVRFCAGLLNSGYFDLIFSSSVTDNVFE